MHHPNTEIIVKKTKGKQKRDMKFIPNKNLRQDTFYKRKAGIIKKAHELAILTGNQILLLMTSESGNVFSYATPKFQTIFSPENQNSMVKTCFESIGISPSQVYENQSWSVSAQEALMNSRHGAQLASPDSPEVIKSELQKPLEHQPDLPLTAPVPVYSQRRPVFSSPHLNTSAMPSPASHSFSLRSPHPGVGLQSNDMYGSVASETMVPIQPYPTPSPHASSHRHAPYPSSRLQQSHHHQPYPMNIPSSLGYARHNNMMNPLSESDAHIGSDRKEMTGYGYANNGTTGVYGLQQSIPYESYNRQNYTNQNSGRTGFGPMDAHSLTDTLHYADTFYKT
ncbi:hypothetical protein HDV02_006022 [Globomyces sp. JEL0801]|nr:hypothetical protein HDV02_006022 [Globomyces sp. JEL0801]